MNERRYQVFVSSTFTDLEDERRMVTQAIMEMKHYPAGMELFPAFDEEQFSFIKRVIDDSDYYVLIIGGRYGSSDETGISYTEKEFDYAVSKGIKVIVCLHKNPDLIPQGKAEKDQKSKIMLQKFREKVSTRRGVKFWSSADELKAHVIISLLQAINDHPAVGWVRGNSYDPTEHLSQINNLRIENEKIKHELEKYQSGERNSSNIEEEFALFVREFHKDSPPAIRKLKISPMSAFFNLAPLLPVEPSNIAQVLKNILAENCSIPENYDIDVNGCRELVQIMVDEELLNLPVDDNGYLGDYDFGTAGKKLYASRIESI